MIVRKLLKDLHDDEGTSHPRPPCSSFHPDILAMIAQTSGRHSKYGNLLSAENNDERPPTRINSMHNFVCVEDDVVESIAACVLMHVKESTRDGYVPPPEYACFTKDVPNINYETVASSSSSLPSHF
jgi:hypothetical protein